MKIAISGKGGVGKTTVAAILALLLVREKNNVLVVDADPDANLAAALSFPLDIRKKIIPISGQKKLIEERTETKIRQYGQIFKINPDVSDVAEKFAFRYNGISLIVIGAIENAGSGCACPESVFMRTLISDLILYKNEVLIIDFEAGIEHLGRATAKGVDAMIIVVEPGQRSIDCAEKIIEMSKEMGIKNIYLIANKIVDNEDEKFIRNRFPGEAVIGCIPFLESIRNADKADTGVMEALSQNELKEFNKVLDVVWCTKRYEIY